MALQPGARIGPYEVTALIGEGGMGKVYRATDTNLKRTVAIKVLPEAVATDVDRLARFQREAELLARLNHRNVAQIHGLERTDGTTALVMELVEGPTLADRIARGPIPVDEATLIAKQIADALEAAHEQGIVHRDLKPANIKIRPDDTVKVLDFGLAKALAPPDAVSSQLTESPTMTSPAMMTAAGILLGTAAYMSPEQARGKPVDKRTDIWAFGAVFYEMLTARRAFAGDDVPSVLVSVLSQEPDWAALPADLPPALVLFIKRCLHKDRKQRLRDIGDMALALERVFEPAAVQSAKSVAVAPPFWRRTPPIALTALVAVLVTAVVAWSLRPSERPRSASRFDYFLAEGQQLQVAYHPVVAIAPDGRFFVYQERKGLYVRAMDELDAHLIPDTEESLSNPLVSPDGQWVGYFTAAGQLKKIAVKGSTPVPLAPVASPLGASWSRDNTILFGQAAGIMRVSADGGKPELIIRASPGESMYGPQLLPDGSSVLFSVTSVQGQARWDVAQVVVQSLSSGKRTVLVERASYPRYVPTGHLVYASGDGIFGIAFDAKRQTTSGSAVPLVQGVQRAVGVRPPAWNYVVSDEGTLVYVPLTAGLNSLVWMNRNGTSEPITSIPAGPYEQPRLSPDGTRVLVTRDGDIWIYELASGRPTRVTRDSSSLMGVWGLSGARVAYSSARSGNLEAWVAPSDGTGQPQQLTHLGGLVHVDAWSADGRTISVHQHLPDQRPTRMFLMRMDRPDAQPEPLFDADLNGEGANLSRDGRYVSYVSSQSSQREVYVRPYPGAGRQLPVSVDGGQEPVLAKNGEIFYRNLTGDRMFVVSVTTAPTLSVGKPLQLFQGPFYVSPSGSPRAQYDVTADGQRLLMLRPTSGTASSVTRPHMVVVRDWFEELKRLVPASPR